MHTPTTTHLLYLHGFRSSPLSAKSRRMAEVVQQKHPEVIWWAPQLPPSPAEAMRLLQQGVALWPHARMAVMGSSLGGFYATCLAQALGCTCVVLNPAVDPARDLQRHIGEHTFWHQPEERFYFAPHYVQELSAFSATLPKTLPSDAPRTLAVIATGDEVLDWQEMHARYAPCQIRLVQGSDHGLTDFEDHVPAILDFLRLA